MTPIKAFIALCLIFTLSACDQSFDDLEQFVEQVKAKPAGTIPPIPVFNPYKAFTYSAQALRPPFEKPIDILMAQRMRGNSAIKPDFSRAKEFLEGFDTDTLTMVGNIANSRGRWGLIQDPESNVHRVSVNNFLGRNHGKIVELGDTFISIVEIVPDGLGGWLERPKTLNLRVPAE